MSGFLQLNKDDFVSLGWNTLIIGGGAAVTYVLNNLSIIKIDPILATAIATFAVKFVNKWVADNTKPIPKP